jgi:thiosulfate/3-mercaptopyruvate sulfurtransferase
MRIFREQVLDLALQGGCLIDARSPEEFRGECVAPPGFPDVGAMRAGRIPGARHLHYSELLDEQKRFKPRRKLEQIFAGLIDGGSGPFVSYCRLSHRGTIVYFALTQLLGLDTVKLYDGSWTEWGNLVGYPIEI